MAAEELNIVVKQIEPGDRLTGLSLGDAAFTPLKIFLQKHAQKYESQSLARTYAAFRSDTDKVAGYITLVCGEVVVDEGDDALAHDPDLKYPYNHYPAVKIARLAVDKTLAGAGLGRALVNLALGQSKRIVCPAVGCRFVMVDSKKQAVKFYEKCGFTLLNTVTNKQREEPVMFMDLNKID